MPIMTVFSPKREAVKYLDKLSYDQLKSIAAIVKDVSEEV